MTALIQKLLVDRAEVLLLHGAWATCSCGQKFDDYTDAENHLVLHHQRSAQNQGNIKKNMPQCKCQTVDDSNKDNKQELSGADNSVDSNTIT
jgi:hypothetical protein